MGARPLCPCCGRPLDGFLTFSDLALLPIGANSSVAVPLIELLTQAWPRPISAAMLVEHVYAGHPNGEPDSAMKSIQVTISKLRRRLPPYGWTITDGRRGGYRLERVAG